MDCTAPQIVVAPEDQKVEQGGVANFYCEATGSPAPDVEWRKSGQRIGRHHKRYLLVEAGDAGRALVLRIEPVRARRDDDTYECHADNGVGTAAVARARLDVYADQQSGLNTASSILVLIPQGGAVVQRVERWTLRSVGRGFKSYSRQRCVTTLGKLFTPMCLCHQAV